MTYTVLYFILHILYRLTRLRHLLYICRLNGSVDINVATLEYILSRSVSAPNIVAYGGLLTLLDKEQSDGRLSRRP
jgi:hypothetical protein